MTKNTAILFALLCELAFFPRLYASDLKVQGIVMEKASRSPIAGAAVSVAGGKAKQDAITDSQGTFILPLTEDVKVGNTIRIRVQKPGYMPFDSNEVASQEKLLQVYLPSLTKNLPASTKKKHPPFAANTAGSKGERSIAIALEEPHFSEDTDTVTLYLGSNTFAWDVRPGSSAEFLMDLGRGILPITLFYEKGRLSFDMAVSDEKGSIITIKHNHFIVRPQDWDWNSSANAFEVVNENLVPVFQAVYEKPSRLVISGVFPCPSCSPPQVVYVSSAGMVLTPSPNPPYFVRPIFKYPSWKHPGEFLVP